MEEKNQGVKIASNTIAQIFGRVIILLISLISIKLITNYFGPSGTGFYNTIITYFGFFIVIADFGLFSVAVREISKNPTDDKKILANIFTVRFISAVIVTLIAVAIIFFTNYEPELKIGVLLASLFPVFNLASSVYDMLFQSRLLMQKVVWAEVISKLFALIIIYLVIVFNLGFYAIAATISISAVLNFIIKAILSRSDLKFGFEYNPKIMKNIIKMSLPLGVVFIVNNIYFKVDTLMLFYFKGAVDVGIYSVAYKIMETTLFAGSYFTSSLKPLLSTSIEDNKERTEKAVTQSITILLFMSLIIAIISFAFPTEIILLLSNSEFLDGAKILMILAGVAVFIYIGGLFGEIMIAKDMRKTLILVSLFILCFNFTLNLFLIPRYSYYGAAYSTLISELILLMVGYFITRKIINIKFDIPRIGKLMLISIFSFLLCYLLKFFEINFIISVFVVSTLYFCACYYLDAIPKSVVYDFFKTKKPKWINR